MGRIFCSKNSAPAEAGSWVGEAAPLTRQGMANAANPSSPANQLSLTRLKLVSFNRRNDPLQHSVCKKDVFFDPFLQALSNLRQISRCVATGLAASLEHEERDTDCHAERGNSRA